MKKFIFCSQKVNRNEIRRETRRGVEHIIIPSYTLPPDIVMNGGLYPADEVEKSYKTLERTPVTVEHPEIDGVYVSANDPEIDFEYRFGAFNENARRAPDGRIVVDKVINVQKAMKTEKGKRLLDRINELEKSENPRPIHTSVGVFVDVEQLDKPMTNDAGQEYRWIARNMVFDHDAILLDSVGAATPDDGTGIGINAETVKVEFVTCDMHEEDEDRMSFDDIRMALGEKIASICEGGCRVVDVFKEHFIYETEAGEMFKSMYSVDDNGNVEVSDSRIPVKRVVTYEPINQPMNEGDKMREKIIEKLKEIGIEVNSDATEEELLDLVANKLKANSDSDGSEYAEVAKTIKEQAEQIQQLQEKLKANEAEQIKEKIKVIRACEKYSAISEAALEVIYKTNKEEFEGMYTDALPTYGVGPTTEPTVNNTAVISTNIDNLPE